MQWKDVPVVCCLCQRRIGKIKIPQTLPYPSNIASVCEDCKGRIRSEAGPSKTGLRITPKDVER